jgi:phage terminase large subunit GpA-like protein
MAIYPLGVDTVKERIYSMLKIDTVGPGYCHFPKLRSECKNERMGSETHDGEFFRQMTSEKLVRKYKLGRPWREFELPAGKRNEALDCRVYAYAALVNLSSNTFKMLEKLWKDLKADSDEIATAKNPAADPEAPETLPTAAPPTPPATPPRAGRARIKRTGWRV